MLYRYIALSPIKKILKSRADSLLLYLCVASTETSPPDGNCAASAQSPNVYAKDILQYYAHIR